MRLDLVCANDDQRPTLSHVLVTKEHLVATNAHVLAVVKTENIFNKAFIDTIGDDRYLVRKADWKNIKPGNTFVRDGDMIKIINNRSKKEVFIPLLLESSVGTYPNWKAVVPRLTDKEPFELSSIGINAQFCTDASKAIGARKCKFTFYGKSRAMELDSSHYDDEDNRWHKDVPYTDNYALIMPVMIND